MRCQHQTKQAATSIHTKKFKESSQETTIHGKIICELHETLREAQDDVTIGTGADRAPEECCKCCTGCSSSGKPTGIPNLNNKLSEAQISALWPLQIDDYGIIIIPTGVMVRQVIALYSKTGGKNSKHGSITATAIFQPHQFLFLSINFLTLLNHK
ncbi:hypothetical protein L208DRAFT_1376320 [Tricholoma matsutake]|nr:hypothetical protein L208DRAFT_1376320 [Tricholoma matsutake 945]